MRGASLDPRAELLLFAAARAQSVRDVLRPALERGALVLCDRFVASTLAYQGYGRGLPLDEVAAANRIATGGLEPGLTLLLDLPPQSGLARATTDPAGDRLRGESLAFHERVRAGYRALAAADRGSLGDHRCDTPARRGARDRRRHPYGTLPGRPVGHFAGRTNFLGEHP